MKNEDTVSTEGVWHRLLHYPRCADTCSYPPPVASCWWSDRKLRNSSSPAAHRGPRRRTVNLLTHRHLRSTKHRERPISLRGVCQSMSDSVHTHTHTCSAASRAHFSDVAPRVAFRIVGFNCAETLPGCPIVSSNSIKNTWKKNMPPHV